jgi:hypothetical protein
MVLESANGGQLEGRPILRMVANAAGQALSLEGNQMGTGQFRPQAGPGMAPEQYYASMDPSMASLYGAPPGDGSGYSMQPPPRRIGDGHLIRAFVPAALNVASNFMGDSQMRSPMQNFGNPLAPMQPQGDYSSGMGFQQLPNYYERQPGFAGGNPMDSLAPLARQFWTNHSNELWPDLKPLAMKYLPSFISECGTEALSAIIPMLPRLASNWASGSQESVMSQLGPALMPIGEKFLRNHAAELAADAGPILQKWAPVAAREAAPMLPNLINQFHPQG